MQSLVKQLETAGDAMPAEPGSSLWMQFMLFLQRTAPDSKLAQQGTRKVFIQARLSKSTVFAGVHPCVSAFT
jgi:GTP cyclohydrolase FolE2